jgi:hypothetical protein
MASGRSLKTEGNMRLPAFAIVVLGLGATVISAQSPSTWISIAEDRSRASIGVSDPAPYQGGPWAAVPASALRPDSNVTAAGFRIRAWSENQKTRVVVFAVIPEEKDREKEIQIATFLLDPGQSIQLTETERYDAAHVTVSAAAEPPR